MAMQFNKPRFDWEAKDRLSELEQFKQECSVLFQGPLSEMKDAQKAGLIVNWIGRQCIMTLHSMGVELDKPKTVFDSLERIFRPESNQTLSRFKFRGLKQKQAQSCDSYMSELRLAIVECRYPDIVQDELLKDQYIFGLCVKEIQDHLLGEIVAEDTPEKCLLESRKVESKIEQRKLLGIKAAISYDAIHASNGFRGRNKFQSKSNGRGRSSSSIHNCKYCGKSHNKGNCPTFGKKCSKCGKDNHFKVVCKSGSSEYKRDHSKHRPKSKGNSRKKFHEINEDEGEVMNDLSDQVQALFYNDIHCNAVNARMHTTLKCVTPDGRSSDQVFKIDTGADGNLMPIKMFAILFPRMSLETLGRTINRGVTLFAYNNTPIKQFGMCSIKLGFKDRWSVCKFFVVEHETALLGINDSEKLGLVNVNFDTVKNEVADESFKQKIEREYPELFKGIGLMDGEISIKLKEGAVPHVEPIRRVPHAMQEPLKLELDKLVSEGILHKVDISEPIEWLNSFVCVRKSNGKIRLCLDPTHLNKWIIRPRHSARLVDDILHRLDGAKFFSVVDSTSSFFNHKLDSDSSKLTTFGTPFGRYRYLRMPMGASLSSDVYQYKVDAHLDKIKNCMAIADDIIMFGYREDGKDHDETVREVLEKAKAVGMRFNPTKCQFRKSQVKFFGLILSRQGVSPDPAKIEALKSLPEPKDEKLLQSFLGMVNYLSRFDPNIANLTHNLRELLKKGSEPKWTDVHSLDFRKIIETLCKEGNILKYYKPDLDLFLETDASGKGIGMALLQSVDNHRNGLYPIAYGSKTLTPAETRYANIERELLGVVGALEKFHYFTFGRPVTVLTDHKPLIAIAKKALVNAPPRLQRLLLRLNNYNATLEWIPGKEMIFADHLSRNVGHESSEVPTCQGLDLKINDVFLNASNDRCVSLAQESDKDETLVALKNVIIKGWPQMRSECQPQLRDFWSYRDELSILDGLVLKGTRIIIPSACRDEVLEKLHEGHFGVEHTKLRARDSVYWPSMYKDIENMVKSCDKCQEFARRNHKDPIIPREIPLVAWTLLELDLFTCENSNFLLVVDVTSRFPVVRILPSESSRSVINALKGIYCDFGLPKRVLSDNGPCFRSFEFMNFHSKLNVKVEKCSAYNHNSVGSGGKNGANYKTNYEEKRK